MDFIERLLHISPDGGNGASEILIVMVAVATIMSIVPTLHKLFPKNFTEYLEQLGKRDSNDRFDQ